MNYLIVVYPGVKSSEPTPMAGETAQELIPWANIHAVGHSFTLWKQNGVYLEKVAYHHNYGSQECEYLGYSATYAATVTYGAQLNVTLTENPFSSGKIVGGFSLFGDKTMDIPAIPLQYRYAVFQNVNSVTRKVGTVLANNHTQANGKALRLFNNRCWVERLSPHPAHPALG